MFKSVVAKLLGFGKPDLMVKVERAFYGAYVGPGYLIMVWSTDQRTPLPEEFPLLPSAERKARMYVWERMYFLPFSGMNMDPFMNPYSPEAEERAKALVTKWISLLAAPSIPQLSVEGYNNSQVLRVTRACVA